MFNLYFLSADVPLTKSFSLSQSGELIKSNYPNAYEFTSYQEQCESLKDVYKYVVAHGNENHCMIKGELNRDLVNESRAGSTTSEDLTWILVLDLDGAPHDTAEEFMNSIEALSTVSYVVQHSSSYGMSAHKGKSLSCHIFVVLDAPVRAPTIKPWLQSLNLTNKTMRDSLSLTKTGANLHWPLDLTTCQNDKLIYIAPPILGKGVKCSIKPSERVQYVVKDSLTLSHTVFSGLNLEAGKTEAKKIINELRKAAGYETLRAQSKWVGEFEVQTKPGEATITGIKHDRGFVYFNINGGDSWGYYHPDEDFELIRNFKGELNYLTKELVPAYYKDCVAQQRLANTTPSESGDIPLAFRDYRTANYYNGTWNEGTTTLELHRAKDKTQLADFMTSRGLTMSDHAPVWEMEFKPQEEYIVDFDLNRINTFIPSEYLRAQHVAPKDWRKACPIIYRTLLHAVSDNVDGDILEHFLNWVAVICQYKLKTITAWVLTGTEGTGKGLIAEHILRMILGSKYVGMKTAAVFTDSFTGWIEPLLFCYIDEVQVSNQLQAAAVSSTLRTWITEHTLPVRHMQAASVDIRSYVNFILSSNKPDPVVVEENDRRYNFGIFQSKKLSITREEIFDGIPAELTAFTAYIMTRAASKQKASEIIRTQTRQNVIESSRSSLDDVGMSIKSGDLGKLWEVMPDLNMVAELRGPDSATASAFAELIKREIRFCSENRDEAVPYSQRYKAYNPRDGFTQVYSKLSRDELYIVFQYCVGNMPSTPNKFTSLLRHRGIATEVMKIGTKSAHGFVVNWEINKKQLNEIIAELDEKPKLKVVSSIKKAQVA
jgi:hypothetical protein